MNETTKLKYLKVALGLIGLFFIFGVYLAMRFLPDSWGWNPSQYEYEQMIIGIYATLGVFLLLAIKDPMANKSLIWFTIWSSVVHGGIMFAQAMVDKSESANLHGDIPALFGVAIVLAILMPKSR